MNITKCIEINTRLFTECYKDINKEGVSDAYIKEFFMFIVICKKYNKPFEYPFIEFERIIKVINKNSDLEKQIIVILDSKDKVLKFTENLDKHLQEFFIDKIYSHFSHNIISKQIELCNVNFLMNRNLVYNLKTMNNVKVSNILELFKKYNNITSKNIIFIKDNKNMELNKTLLYYKINNDNTDIEVVLSQTS